MSEEEQQALRDDNHYFIDNEQLNEEANFLLYGTLIMFCVFICVLVFS